MRLRVNVNRPDKAQLTWTVAYANPELAGSGPVTVSAVRNTAFPIIRPVASAAGWDEAKVAMVAVNVAAKQVNDGDAETFGRYLFEVLIGAPLLATINAAGPLDAIEIATDDTDFSRLPWEMMWLEDDFAARKGVGVIRVVPARSASPEIALEPKVLFVVGSDLNDARIRPGAEYLGLLRRLEQRGLAIESHVLARATPKRIQDTVGELRPSVIHFICHGGGRGSGYLELVSDDNGKSFDRLTAEQLVDLTAGIPKAMVMNACESGKPSLDSAALALSMALRGTPVVVGMAGRVADRACRLFTRRFYEALVSGAAVDGATAAARKDAMDVGTDPRKTVDWAMPTIFLHDGARVRFDPAATTMLQRRVAIAAPIRRLTDPGLVCGRGECLDAHRNLLDGRAADRPRVLVLKVAERAASIQNPRYGKTRIVEEIGARAAVRGHVPCILTFPASEGVVKAPKTAWELAKQVVQAILQVRMKFGLDEDAPSEVLRLQEVKAGSASADTLSAAVRTQLQLDQMQPNDAEPPVAVIRAALLADLESLARAARAAADAVDDLKVVVLFDDLHAYGGGGRTLVEQWLTEYGLGRAAKDDAAWQAGRGPIPVVLTYSAVTLDIYKADVDAIRTYSEVRPSLFRAVDLKAFDPPSQDDLPYQQFLLARSEMLVLRSDLPLQMRDKYLARLHQKIAGIPSRLSSSAENGEVHAVVEAGIDLEVLEVADDDQALRALHGGG
jgi:CHAT domain-containing protein